MLNLFLSFNHMTLALFHGQLSAAWAPTVPMGIFKF